MESLRLIDFSTEDDFLVASICGEDDGDGEALEGLLLSVTSESRNGQDVPSKFHNQLESEKTISMEVSECEEESVSSTCVSPEVERQRSMYGVRKSLAWDSAFFTSEGILDPEELSIVTRGLESGKTSFLPGILEDLQKSTDSNSTLDSDPFSLASSQNSILDTDRFSIGSLESDLFQDIRTSIRAFNVGTSGFSTGSASLSTPHSATKFDASSRKKNTSVSKCQSVGVRGSGRTKSEFVAHPKTAQDNLRSGSVSRGCSLKVVGQTKPKIESSIKRTSLSANHAKMETKYPWAASFRGSKESEKASTGKSANAIPGITRSSISSNTTASLASSDSTVTSSHSRSPIQLSSNSFRKKIDSAHAEVPASGAKLKVTKSYPKTSKARLENSETLSSSFSISSSSSCSSLATSIDECNSESSSLSSAVSQAFTNLSSHMDTDQGGGPSEGNANHAFGFQRCPCHLSSSDLGNQETTFQNHRVLRSKTEMSPMAKDAERNLKASNHPKPTPKFGFSDERKGSQVHTKVAGASLKTEIGVCSGIGKESFMRPKPQPSRTTSEGGTMTPGVWKSGVVRPAAAGAHDRFGLKRECTGVTSKIVKTGSFSMSRRKCMSSAKGGTGFLQEAEPGCRTGNRHHLEGSGGKGDLKKKARLENRRQIHNKSNKISLRDDGNVVEFDLRASQADDAEASKEYNVNGQILCDDIDGISRQVGGLDLCDDIIIELRGMKSHFHIQPCTKSAEECAAHRYHLTADQRIHKSRTATQVK